MDLNFDITWRLKVHEKILGNANKVESAIYDAIDELKDSFNSQSALSHLDFRVHLATYQERKPGPNMTKDLIGKLFGDRGYISQKLFEELYQRGLELVTKSKKKMKNRLVKLIDKILLRKRAVIESVNDHLKNMCQI